MSKLQIKRLPIEEMGSELQEVLDIFIENHGGTVFHETAMNRFASEAYGTRITYFLAFKGLDLVGCMPCHTFRRKLLRESHSNLSSFELPYGGWVFDQDNASINDLTAQTKLGIFESLHIKSNIEAGSGHRPSNLVSGISTLNTVLLKLSDMSLDELYASLGSKQRYKIRHAEKIGIEVVHLTPNNLDIFLELFTVMKDRAGLLKRDNDFYRKVFSHYYLLNRAICLSAFYESEHISSLIILANQNYSIWWLAGRKSGLSNSLYQNELLLWESIRWAKAYGSKYFDLCGIEEEKLPHLARIKLSFSKDIHSIYSYSIRPMTSRIASRLRKGYR